ncbi:fungal-specific transcription factor domain-containing protein [Colletotrichum acutatum]|uniref:Fungal-specific transcription factor domain-containing protein n=1 Tax=Glomerella acutata TaxID=27357 RepID=A0AAD8XKP5_GLOAC|nr:fungal-specific transcription factor domain-containing protein [Colletotrichum acutatum]KAK1729167.1 fungal-specific transcription factor domain-containing protein [Colletotrichum acutatum]
MTSVLPAHPATFKSSTSLPSAGPATMATNHEPRTSPQHFIKQEHESGRGRLREVSEDKDADIMDDDGDEGKAGSSNSDGGPARKRRRSRKGLDKKFECPQEGCGKSYSRAEHLYRHQLNHTPKQIYACDFPDCSRTFVRLDLCNRHRDRHTAKGSALNRKDSMMSHISPTTDRPPFPLPGSASPEISRPGTGFANMRQAQMQYQSPKDVSGSPFIQATNTPPGYPIGVHPGGMDGYMHHDNGYGGVQAHRPPQQSPSGPRPVGQTNGSYMSPVANPHGYHTQPHNTPHSAPYTTQQNFPQFNLPPSDFSNGAGNVPREGQTYAPTTSAEYSEQGHPQQSGEMMLLDQMSMPGTIPVFGTDSILSKSPYVTIPEDFVAYLFNTQQGGEGSPMGQMVAPGYVSNYGEYQNPYSVPYVGTEGVPMGYFPSGPHQVMAVNNLLDQNLPEATISEEKSQEIYDFINQRFHDNDEAPAMRQRESILEGDRSDGDHMLSKRMMQAYIGSYWVHFSDQIPILHKPTFSPDRTPNLLLLAMMTIGAACLDKTHGQKVTKAGAQLSNFLAWHLRWEIFMDPNFRPPAKLWLFQTLLLLELYEKMYSTRELHERAHIHHATTITLMRRGRSLIGKSSLDSPPNPRDDKTNSSRHSSASGMAHTADEWWNHWITNESTRRAAFAAFVIDSIHATMFGHSTVMVTHEMRLPLPCDEALWKATSGAEVGRVESNLLSNGVKPISFLEGLKRTLSGQGVQTNPFGRMVLMAGLLSVSWHMNQRDLQVNVLGGGVSQALGGRDKWRGTLTRAFDAWKEDFDKSLTRTEGSSDPYRYDSAKKNDANVVFESRTVLHHLAHMAMHVDIVDCQIFARAKRLLGRAIGQQDLNSAQRRMKDIWAPTAKARDATFYALKFISSVLIPDGGHAHQPNGFKYDEPYTARDDVLLNRPWVLYFAALVVWCYGFALEGPCPDVPPPTSKQEQLRKMREYLLKYGGASSPDELKAMKGINENTAMLLVLKDSFETTRWELLHEGANLLSNCLQLNAGATTL